MREKAKAATKRLVKFTFSSHVTLLLALEIVLGVVISLTTLYVFLKIADGIFENQITTFDQLGLNYFFSLRTPELTQVMTMITALGSGAFLLVVSVIMTGIIYLKRHHDALIFVAILYSGIAMNFLLKFLFLRDRPGLAPLIIENTYSFPSGDVRESDPLITAPQAAA